MLRRSIQCIANASRSAPRAFGGSLAVPASRSGLIFRGMSSEVTITASMVKQLRDTTGSPMMDCKRALQDAGGDHEKALEWLRKKGMATAAKKESRKSADGLVCGMIDASGKRGSVVEVNSETDFVARNPSFQELVRSICALHLTGDAGMQMEKFKGMELAKGPQTEGKISVEAAVKEMVATVGENCQMRSAKGIAVAGPGGVYKYLHTPMGDNVGKVGCMVGLECDTKNTEELAKLGYSLAMHVAAGNPLYNNIADIPASDVEKEKNIFIQQAEESGKTREIAEKMTMGRIKKWHEEVVLHEQEYLIGEGKKKVKDVLKEFEKTLGAPVKIAAFIRVKCGQVAAEEAAAAEAAQ